MIFFNKRYLIKFLYIVIDVVFISISFYFACLFRKETLTFPLTFPYFLFNQANPYEYVFLFWGLVIILFNTANDLYETHREISESIEVAVVIKSVFLSSLITIVAIYISKAEGFPRSIVIISVALIIFFLSMWRVLKRVFVQHLVAGGYNNFNVLIIGAGKVGAALQEEIKKRPTLGLKVVGFLDDFKINDPQSSTLILGKISDFVNIARKEFVNKIFITVHHDSQVFLKTLEDAQQLGIAVRVIPQGFDLTTGEFCKYNIGFIPILEYCEAVHARKQFGKRLFDIVISLCSVIVLSPIFIFLALFIKLDSPGPVFYISKRYGVKGKVFYMLKFRSMRVNADQMLSEIRQRNEVDGPIFKIKQDPRVTNMGRFLRKYSLDELPQIFNVVLGDMSLVGPRPLPIEQIEKEDLRQLKRLEVHPGITGLWQIRGRSDISFSRLVKWDIWYINNWSFWLDLNILFQTIPVVLKGKGAY